jgi:hypothetical protein
MGKNRERNKVGGGGGSPLALDWTPKTPPNYGHIQVGTSLVLNLESWVLMKVEPNGSETISQENSTWPWNCQIFIFQNISQTWIQIVVHCTKTSRPRPDDFLKYQESIIVGLR